MEQKTYFDSPQFEADFQAALEELNRTTKHPELFRFPPPIRSSDYNIRLQPTRFLPPSPMTGATVEDWAAYRKYY